MPELDPTEFAPEPSGTAPRLTSDVTDLVGAGEGLFAYLEATLDPTWYFHSPLSLAPTTLLQEISGIRLPVQPGADALYETAYSIMMEKVASLLVRERPGGNALRRFSNAARHRMTDPAVCAKLIAERREIEAGLSESRRETKELLRLYNTALSTTEDLDSESLWYDSDLECWKSDLLDDYNESGSDDYPTALDRFGSRGPILADEELEADLILREATKYMDGETLWRERASLAETLSALHSCLHLASLHPLIPTLYTLYVPYRERARVAKSVEFVLKECSSNPKAVLRLKPREFELLVARLFEAQGYNVEVTSQTRDGGKDVICMKNDHGVPFKVAVEAKRYRPDRPVCVSLVRSFVGANAEFLANKLVYVSTSGYTRTAQLYAKTHGVTHLLELKSLPDIMQWASEAKP